MNGVLVTASIGVSLLAGEVAVRIWAPQFLRPVFRERVGGLFFLRPNLDVRVYSPSEFDTRARTTSQRFRGQRIYSPFPAPGTFRVATLGDSFTFGTGAEDTECYPAILERLLDGAARDTRVEVLNAGIPNAGPGDEALWFDHWVSGFHPHLTILMVYGGNDVSDEIHDSKFSFESDSTLVPLAPDSLAAQAGTEGWLQQRLLRLPGYDFLTQRSHLLYAVRSALTEVFAKRDKPTTAEPRSDPATLRAVSMIAAEVRWLRKKAETNGSRFVVVYVPPREELNRRSNPEAVRAVLLEAKLAEESRAHSIPFLDFDLLIRNHFGQSGPTSLYFEKDDHMRPQGYRFLAEGIARFVTDSILPSELGRGLTSTLSRQQPTASIQPMSRLIRRNRIRPIG
jgi:lysophospholipase L1-like esterase